MIDLTNGRPGTYTTNLTYIVSAERVPVDLSLLTANYTAESGDILTGKAPENVGVTIAGDAIVTLLNVDITSISNDVDEEEEPLHPYAGITCAGNVTLILSGNNKVKGGCQEYPGIHVVSDEEHPKSTLTIKGTGSLEASSNGWAAGIGGGYNIACGNIVIEGGSITATGGQWAAGIGSGYGKDTSCGNISITGGTITATGGEGAAGIGSGNVASCGTISITSGVTKVTATAGGGSWSTTQHSIGAGNNGSCAGVTIGGQNTGNISKSPYTYPES